MVIDIVQTSWNCYKFVLHLNTSGAHYYKGSISTYYNTILGHIKSSSDAMLTCLVKATRNRLSKPIFRQFTMYKKHLVCMLCVLKVFD